MLVTLGTSFFAGLVAILSPCVLPLLPILLVSALQQHKYGPIGLVLGISITFTAFGMALAATGSVFGADEEMLRVIMASVLIILGLVLMSEALQNLFARAVTPFANRVQSSTSKLAISGFWGQFILGLLLGGAWIPCTGPTLAVATSLAVSGDNLQQAALIMFMYSLGVSLPIIGISYLARGAIADNKKWMKIGKTGKRILGLMILLVGLLLITEYDRKAEAWLLTITPDWLLEFTTKY